MRRFVTLVALAVLCLPAVAQAAPADYGMTPAYESKSLERSDGVFDREAYTKRQRDLSQRLAAAAVERGLARPLVVEVTEAERAAVANPEIAERRVRVGITKEVGAAVRFSPRRLSAEARTLPFGAVRGLDSGGYVWTGAVESPGAAAIRLRFSDLTIPDGAELYVYNDRGQAFGPWASSDGDLWTPALRGERAVIQLRQEGPVGYRSVRSPSFTLSGVAHLTEEFLLALYPVSTGERELVTREFCSFNEQCVENANCESTSSAVNDARDAVALMVFSSGPWQYICSGGLIADADASTDIPYFVTANHCISKGREASSLTAYFQFETECGGSCDLTGSVPTANGSDIVATNKTSDYTLLQLSEQPPAGSVWLGWTSSPVAFSHGTALYRISHPAGAPQAYSEHLVDTDKGTCSSWPRGDWIYSHDTLGATEGGSSGSPVVNSSGQLVGQLSGACGFNVNDPCDSASNATVDGAFAAYFTEVEPWLDPGDDGGGSDPCADNGGDADGDGWCADTDCDDGDASVNPGASEICDGVDNNCDGVVDEGCGSSCLPVGDLCSSDSDCCSFKCRGRPGGKTCK